MTPTKSSNEGYLEEQVVLLRVELTSAELL
jgi:hypothetical protein